MSCLHCFKKHSLFSYLGNPSPQVRHVRSSERRQWLLLPRDFDSKNLLNADET